MAVAIGIGRYLPAQGKLMTIAFAAIVALAYIAVLLVTRELGRADLDNVKAVVSRKPR
jgi:hypothetical protein